MPVNGRGYTEIDRKNFFFDQDLSYQNLNDVQTNVESSLKDMVVSLFGYGIVTGLNVTVTQEPSLQVKVSGGSAYSTDGSSIKLDGDINVDIALDYNGEATAVTTAGQTRWVSLFIYPSYVLSDPRVDGTGREVYFSWQEGSLIRVVKGAVGGGTPVDPEGGGIVIADIRRYATQSFVNSADIYTTRRIVVERDVSGHRSAITIDHPDDSIPASKLRKGTVTPDYFDREYLSLKGGVMEGEVDLDGFRIKNLPSPISASDPATKEYADRIITSTSFNVDAHRQANPIDHPTSSVTPEYLDRLYVEAGGGEVFGAIDMTGNLLNNVGYPTAQEDGASAEYANDVAQGSILFDTATNKTYRLYVSSGTLAVEEISPFLPVAPRTWVTPESQTGKSYILHVTNGSLATEEVAYLGQVRGLMFKDRVTGTFYELHVNTSGVLSVATVS